MDTTSKFISFSVSILVTVWLLSTVISSCSDEEGVMSYELTIWNADSTAFFNYRQYSLGPPAGYATIEIDGEEVLRYDELTVVFGGWRDNRTIKIVASDPPIKNKTRKTNLNFIIEKAESYDDYKMDSFLINLSG